MRVENAKDELKIIKSSIKNRNEARKNASGFIENLMPKTNNDLAAKLNVINEDINSWKYVGKIYRVIDRRKSRVEYHQLIKIGIAILNMNRKLSFPWINNTSSICSTEHLRSFISILERGDHNGARKKERGVCKLQSRARYCR